MAQGTRRILGRRSYITGNQTAKPDGEAGGNDGFLTGIESAVDPASIGRGSSENTGTGERERKATGTTAKASPRVAVNVAAVEATLFSIHQMLAFTFKRQELLLEKEEARRLAEGLARVSKHYPALQTVVSEKVQDHAAFLFAVVSVYGTRAVTIMNNNNQKPQATVHPFQPRQGPSNPNPI